MVRQMYKGGVDKTGWCETRVLPDNYFRVKNTTSSLDKFNDWLPNPINVGLFWKLCTVFEKDVGSQMVNSGLYKVVSQRLSTLVPKVLYFLNISHMRARKQKYHDAFIISVAVRGKKYLGPG